MKKRGQFYLVAALVIIGVIASLATVYNSVKVSEEDESVYDLSDEINYEALQLLDNWFLNTLSDSEINHSITELITAYSLSNPDTDLIILYGDRDLIDVFAYIVQTRGEVCFGTCILVTSPQFIRSAIQPENNGDVVITIGDNEYIFKIKENEQNFYLVLRKEKNGDILVSTSQKCSNIGDNCCSDNTCENGLICGDNGKCRED